MTKTEKKIQQLERRINFLLLSLKIINQEVENYAQQNYGKELLPDVLYAACYYSNPENIKSHLKFIEEENLNYNFYNKLMHIKEYELDEKKGESL